MRVSLCWLDIAIVKLDHKDRHIIPTLLTFAARHVGAKPGRGNLNKKSINTTLPSSMLIFSTNICALTAECQIRQNTWCSLFCTPPLRLPLLANLEKKLICRVWRAYISSDWMI